MGWTEHVAMPEPEPEPHIAENPYLVPREPTKVDDGRLHPQSRDLVFADAPRGAVPSLGERSRITADSITSLRGLQVAGAATFTALCWYLALHGIRGDGSHTVGLFAVLGVLVPLGTRAAIQVQLRNEFWWHWCASRGFDPGIEGGPTKVMPSKLNRSPLFGPLENRVIECSARRLLCRREAVAGSLLRMLPPADDLDPRSTSTLHRASFVVMPIPEVAAARWAGASIRADHDARRPLRLRAMLGASVASGVPGATSHVTAIPTQDIGLVHGLVDARMEQYLVEHPMDVDIVGSLLVVMRDGAPTDGDSLDDLCRDALLFHELLVADHEIPEVVEAPRVAMPEDQPTIDPSREGWGEQPQEWTDDDEGSIRAA